MKVSPTVGILAMFDIQQKDDQLLVINFAFYSVVANATSMLIFVLLQFDGATGA